MREPRRCPAGTTNGAGRALLLSTTPLAVRYILVVRLLQEENRGLNLSALPSSISHGRMVYNTIDSSGSSTFQSYCRKTPGSPAKRRKPPRRLLNRWPIAASEMRSCSCESACRSRQRASTMNALDFMFIRAASPFGNQPESQGACRLKPLKQPVYLHRNSHCRRCW